MSAKMELDFAGVDDYIERLKKFGDDSVHNAVDDALRQTQALIAQKCAAAMQPHRQTGRTAASIITNAPPEWTGETAAIPVGFDIENGGLPSLFLMHGTTVHGQPHEKPDIAVYNAVYGAETRREAHEFQREALGKAIREAMQE